MQHKTFVQIKINGKLVKYEFDEGELLTPEEADRRAMLTDKEVEG